MKTQNPFYNSKRWRRLRGVILRRDGYMDQLELRNGNRVEAETVHHIFPIDKYPQYRWAPWNLIAVSRNTHELLHNRVTGELSALGLRLLEETARKQGIQTSTLTLVVGLPGSGKTTWVQRNLGGGLAYDLDHLAAAFRLSAPHKERHEAARRMANGMAKAFAQNARRYCGIVYIIRAAPSVEEVEEYEPDRIVICGDSYDITARKDYVRVDTDALCRRLEDIKAWASANEIQTVYVTGGHTVE